MKIFPAAAILLISVQSLFAQLVPFQTNSVWLSDSSKQYDTIVGVQARNELWFYAYSIGTNSFSLANYTVKYYWNDEPAADDVTTTTNISGTVSGNKITFAPTTNTWRSLIDSGYSEIIVTDTNGANYVLARGSHNTVAAPGITVTEPFKADIIVNWADFTFTNTYASGPVLIRWGLTNNVGTNANGSITYTINTNQAASAITSGVASVFGRIGVVTAQAGDYAAHYATLAQGVSATNAETIVLANSNEWTVGAAAGTNAQARVAVVETNITSVALGGTGQNGTGEWGFLFLDYGTGTTEYSGPTAPYGLEPMMPIFAGGALVGWTNTISGANLTAGTVSSNKFDAATRALLGGGSDSYTKTITVSPSGGDYTTIQAALNVNTNGSELFLVYPGTYTNDTINLTANNQQVRGMCASPKCTLITSTSAISDFGATTGGVIENIKMVMTLPANTLGTTVTGTGSCNYRFCHVECNASGTNSDAGGSACYDGAGSTVKVVEGSVVYSNSTVRGTKGKKAVNVEAGSSWTIDDVTFTVTGSGTSSSMSAVRDTSTGNVLVDKCSITVTDSGSTATYGVSIVNGNGDVESKYNDFHIVNNTGIASGVYLDSDDTPLSVRSSFNHIHATSSGGSAYWAAMNDTNCTLTSQMDDMIAADGTSLGGGTLVQDNSTSDGSHTASGTITANEFAGGGAGITGADTNALAQLTTHEALDADAAHGETDPNYALSSNAILAHTTSAHSVTDKKGFRAGLGATATSGGGIGWETYETGGGGAIGTACVAGSGFSGGSNAVSTGNAIQLGHGANTNANTLQIYDTQLLDANGNVPTAAITNHIEAALATQAAAGETNAVTSAGLVDIASLLTGDIPAARMTAAVTNGEVGSVTGPMLAPTNGVVAGYILAMDGSSNLYLKVDATGSGVADTWAASNNVWTGSNQFTGKLTITTNVPTAGQVATYNATDGKWCAATPSADLDSATGTGNTGFSNAVNAAQQDYLDPTPTTLTSASTVYVGNHVTEFLTLTNSANLLATNTTYHWSTLYVLTGTNSMTMTNVTWMLTAPSGTTNVISIGTDASGGKIAVGGAE